MSNSFDFKSKTYCLITGASRGIGKTIALEFAKKILHQSSTIVLVAKSQIKLDETKDEILAVNKNIKVFTESVDLEAPSSEKFEQILDKTVKEAFENCIIIHNAGSIGNVDKKAADLGDLGDWRSYFSVNFFSVAVLNSVFFKHARKAVGTDGKIFVVNMTSLAGRQGMPSLAQYGSAKAARDLFFKVLAVEEENAGVIVLNYSPGPVKTDMASEILEKSVDSGMKEQFQILFDENKILTTEITVGKFLTILENGKYLSGAILDYFDSEIVSIMNKKGIAIHEGLIFLLKLAWESRFRLPILLTVLFMALDLRVQVDINIHGLQNVDPRDLDGDSESEYSDATSQNSDQQSSSSAAATNRDDPDLDQTL